MSGSEQALVLMTRNDIITTEVLNTLWGNGYGGEVMRYLKNKKYATEIKLQFTSGAKCRKYSRTCFAITQEGINFLIHRGYDINLLIKGYTPDEKYTARKKASPSYAAARILKETTANSFFTQYGAITLPVVAVTRTGANATPSVPDATDDDFTYLDNGNYMEDDFFEDDDFINTQAETKTSTQASIQKQSIVSMIRLQQKTENDTWGTAPIPDNALLFITKSTMRNSSVYAQEYRELSMSECSGILASPRKAMVVYTGTSDGMSWLPNSRKADTTIIKAFMYNHKIPRNNFGTAAGGILLASSPEILSGIFFNKGKKKNKSHFGDGLNALYVLPMTQDGMSTINHLMLDDLVKQERSFIATLCSSGSFYNNEVQSDAEFNIIEEATGALCACGIDMNFNRIVKWHSIISNEAKPASPSSSFSSPSPHKIICYRFQVPYYRAVLGELCDGYVVVDKEARVVETLPS